ncbi:MAG: peptide deformylase [Candidatus Jorgensenbacteria bacterium]|nr:peptide deformylase [Candidatus Jorgensenbacteria bacterium]
MDKIYLSENKDEEKLLRKKTVPFDFSKFTKQDIRELIRRMREAMREANGVGLSANQIGLPYRVFVAQVPDSQGKQKSYAIFNPEITKTADETEISEEGCLSVPRMYGPIERSYRVFLTGFDKNGKRVKIKAWGLLARVFQHETDHLDGKLFIDKAKSLYKVEIEKKGGNRI